jgi:hypothetical protein
MLAIVLTAAQLAAAQDSPGVTIGVDKCLGLEKRDERLACFDAQVEAAKRAPAPASAAPAAASSAPAPAAASSAPAAASSAPAAASGAPAAASNPPAAASGAAAAAASAPAAAAPASTFGDPVKRRDEDAPDLVAKIADLRETVPNTYLITLDNGQVWRQTQSQAYPLRPGLDVRVRQSKWGYRLSAPELRGQIPVERVR